MEMIEIHNAQLADAKNEVAKLTERRIALLREIEGLPAQNGFVAKVDAHRFEGNIFDGEVC